MLRRIHHPNNTCSAIVARGSGGLDEEAVYKVGGVTSSSEGVKIGKPEEQSMSWMVGIREDMLNPPLALG